MTDRIQVQIIAQNGATRVFQEVSRDADRMGTSVEAAGKKGSKSFTEWSDAAKKVGAAIGAVGAVAIKLAGDAEAAEARLTTAFTNAGLAVEDYQSRIDRLADEGLDLGFDDEDVTDSLARLIGATGDYEQAVTDLAIAQDLARSRQISLAEATNTVLAVEAGRFRSLAQMGIALDETATKEEALAAVQQRVAGSAEAFAETGAADFQRWQNTAENALESVGSHFVELQGPILAASAGVTAFGTVASALSKVEIGAKLASVAMGPAGLVAGVVAAGAAFVFLTDRTQAWEDTASAAEQATVSLNDRIGELAAFGQQDIAGPLQGVNEEWSEVALRAAEIAKAINDVNVQISELENQKSNAQPPLTQSQQLILSQQIDHLAAYREELEKLALSSGQIDDITADILSLFSKPGINAQKAADDIAFYFQQFEDGMITGEQLVAWIDESAADWTRYSVAVVLATDAQAAFNRQVETTSAALTAQTNDLRELISAREVAADAKFAKADEVAASMASLAADSVADLTVAVEDQEAAFTAAWTAIRAYAEALGQMPAGETFGARLAQRAGAAGAALGDAFRTGVGNVGDLGGQAAQVAAWAEELGNVEDGYSELNQLFDEGRLTAEEYNAAIESGNRIQAENVEIQRNVLDIQATQLPILADLTAQQQRYLEHIAQQPAELQAVALAYMDAETSAKALEVTQLAAAAAAGELGAAGEATAEKMIQGAVAADPYLAALLEDMGLISVGADGTITVNFESVESAGASLDDVVDSLGELNDLLAAVFGILIDDGQVTTAQTNVEGLIDDVEVLDGTDATVDVSVTGALEAQSQLQGVADLANSIPSNVTTTITTIRQEIGQSPFLHGGVAGYADGGVVARMAEAGPELLYFRDGGMGIAARDGLYNVPRGTYVTPAPASKAALSRSGGITIEHMTVVANNPREFAQQLYEFEMGGVRS
jgi:hypothetical protein